MFSMRNIQHFHIFWFMQNILTSENLKRWTGISFKLYWCNSGKWKLSIKHPIPEFYSIITDCRARKEDGEFYLVAISAGDVVHNIQVKYQSCKMSNFSQRANLSNKEIKVIRCCIYLVFHTDTNINHIKDIPFWLD